LVEGKGVVVAVAAGAVERGNRRKDGWRFRERQSTEGRMAIDGRTDGNRRKDGWGAMWRVAQTSGETADDDDGGRET